MSVALDTALYLRDQIKAKDLSLADRGVLFTLMFRVGSNPFTWISQKELAIELDIDESNVRRHMSHLVKSSLIEIMKDHKDQRKNLYKPAEFLINYHQSTERNCTKNYRAKSPGNSGDTAQNRPVYTAQNRPVSHESKNLTAQQPLDVPLNEKSPKDTYKITSKAKQHSIVLPTVDKSVERDRFFEFKELYPRKQAMKKAEMVWKRKKLDRIADEIFTNIHTRLTSEWKDKEMEFIPLPGSFLVGERWKDVIISTKTAKISSRTNDLNRPAIKEWGPGHESFDANFGDSEDEERIE